MKYLISALAGGAVGWMLISLSELKARLSLARKVRAIWRGGALTQPYRFHGIQAWGQRLIQFLNRKKTARDRLNRLPDFLDLMAMGQSSGLNFLFAWKKALEYLPETPVTTDLNRCLKAFEMGQPVNSIFADLRRSWDDSRMMVLVSLLEQGFERGFALKETLHKEAASLRRELLTNLEKQAETAKVKLSFPIVLFIFPAVFLILFGAILLQFIQEGGMF